MLLITALKRLANKGIELQKEENKYDNGYSFEKGGLIFQFGNSHGDDTVNNFNAWDKETQETFYFANFKNMMIYYNGLNEQFEQAEKIQEVEQIKELEKKHEIEESEEKPKREMNLQELNEKGIKQGIEDFHYYLEELGYEKEKNIMLEHPTFEAVKKYIKDYELKNKGTEVPEIVEELPECPYCQGKIKKSNDIRYKEYVCLGCDADFDADEWEEIQEAMDLADTGPVENGSGCWYN